MKKQLQLLTKWFCYLFVFVLLSKGANAQALTGTKTIPGTYSSIALAIADLNANGVGAGGVTFNITAGYTETISATLSVTATGTLANQIIFQKNGSGANPKITSYVNGSGTPATAVQDGIWQLVGSDYVTINGIDLAENAANTTNPATMEFGFGLFKASETNGCQNNTIKNCVISLSSLNNATGVFTGINGSTGILMLNGTPAASTAALVITSAGGASSLNKFYANTIQNVNTGIALNGYAAPAPYSLSDMNNDIGGSVLSNGNTILNFGGAAAATNFSTGIYINDQWNFTIGYNTINNNNGSGVNHVNALRGILTNGAPGADGTIANNTITLKAAGTTFQVSGIENVAGATAGGNTITIKNNSILNCEYLTATTGSFAGIWNQATAAAINITGNTISGFQYSQSTLAGSGSVRAIYNSGTSSIVTVYNNTVSNMSATGTSGATSEIISITAGTTQTVRKNTINTISVDGTGTASTLTGILTSTGTIVVDSNTVSNLTVFKTTGTGNLMGINNGSAPTNENFNYNTIYNLTHNGTGTVTGINQNTAAGTRTVSYNTIYNFTGKSTVTGIAQALSSPSIYNNKIYDLTTNGTTTVVSGITISSLSSGSSLVYNNVIGRLFAPVANTATATVIGINITATTGSTTHGIYNNTVYLNATSTGAIFSSAGIFHTSNATATTSNLDMRNNIIVNVSTANSTGKTASYRRSATTLTNYNALSNRNFFYAGTPSASNVLFYDGANFDQTLSTYITRVTPRDTNSVSAPPTFISTIGANARFLQLDSTVATITEGYGFSLTQVNTDFLNNVRAGKAGYSGLSGLPDLGAYEAANIGDASNQMVLDSMKVVQTATLVPKASVNNTIQRIALYSSKGYNALQATQFKFEAWGTTSFADVTNVKVYYTGVDSTFSNPVLFGSLSSLTSTFYISGSKRLLTGSNYFWLTYDVSNTAGLGNFLDAQVDSVVLSNANYAPMDGNPIGDRKILASLNGNYEVGSGYAFATLTEAFDNLNNLGVSGPVTFILKSAAYNVASGEVFPLTLNAYPGSSSINKVTIRPDVGVFSLIESASAIAAIDLNGVSNIIIDGRPGGVGSFVAGNSLVIANTNANGPAIRFINEASSNKVLYTDLRSNNITPTASAGAGVVNFATTTGINGNDNNTIKYCDIHETTGGNPVVGISSIGSATTVATNNDGNIIDSCNIYNFFNATIASAGVYVGANNGSWTIINNHVFQTSPLTYTTNLITHRGLWITPNTGSLTSASGFVINNNYIGGAGADGSGVYTMTGTATHLFCGLDISVGLGTETSIQNNSVTNIDLTSASVNSGTLVALNVANGTVAIANNIIGSTSLNGAINYTTTGTTGGGFIGIRASAGNLISIRKNKISGINVGGNATTAFAEFFGINLSGGINITVDSNTIGEVLMPNSINHISASATSTGASRMSGIIVNPSVAGINYTITNNTIANINSNYSAPGAQAASVRGIYVIPTGASSAVNITGNVVYNLSAASQTTGSGLSSALIGIAVNSTVGKYTVSKNEVHSLTLTGTSTTAAVQNTGLFYSTPATDTNLVSRNFIHSLSLSAINAAAVITGMDISAGNGTVVNNMVRLGIDSTGTDITTACTIRGITKNSGSNTIYFNTVYIGGSNVDAAGTNRTFAFQRTGAGTDDIRNNIFVNARLNSLPGIGHFAVGLNNATSLTQNFNLLSADSIGLFNGTGAFNLQNWKTASGVDVNSISSLAGLVNAIGNKTTVNLHIDPATATPIEAYGSAVTAYGTEVDFDGQTRSGLTPIDLGADAGNFTGIDIAPPIINYTALINTVSNADRVVLATITDATGVYFTGTLQPRIYFRKMNAITYASVQGVRVSGTPTNSVWSFTISTGLMSGLSPNDSVYYYVVAQDSTSGNNLGSWPSGVEGLNVNNITVNPNPNGYLITPIINGSLDVGAGKVYTTLTGANGVFNYINNAIVNGDITINITSDIEEPGTIGLNEITEQGVGGYSVKIVPDGAVLHNITGSAATGLIRLNGSDRVVVDGSSMGSGRYLRFMNRPVSGSTFLFMNDAHRDTIMNCIVEGASTAAGTATILFGTSNKAGGTGNDSNAVMNCVIRDTLTNIVAAAMPNIAINSLGSAGFENSNNSILNNEIFNFGASAISLAATGTGSFWILDTNSVYQVLTKNAIMDILSINGGSGHTMRNNSIGGSGVNRSGTALNSTGAITVINLGTQDNTAPLTISQNKISNIACLGTSGLKCIYVNLLGAQIVNITNNIMGGASTGIAGVAVYDTLRNSGLTGMIDVNAGSPQINNNILSDFRQYTATTNRHSAIFTSGATVVAKNNIIKNIESFSTQAGFGGGTLAGIDLNGGSGHTIEGNTISDIRNLNTGTVSYTVVGIHMRANGVANTTVQRNRISRISSLGTGVAANAPIVVGIRNGTDGHKIYNNQVSVGNTVIGKVLVAGIQNGSTTTGSTVYYGNTVYIDGNTDTVSYCLQRVSTGVVNAMNNIFYNTRNAAGGSKQYAIGSTNAITSASFNYNLMVVNDTAALFQSGSNGQGWAALNALYTSGYNTNWTEKTASIPATGFFVDVAMADLGIVTTDPSAWYANGKGIALAGMSGDYANVGGIRPTSIAAGAVDIGSVEFTPTSLPPVAYADKLPVAFDSTQFFFGGRVVAKAKWEPMGSVPSSVDVRYYSGVKPANASNGTTCMNAYWDMQATGGSLYEYTLSLMSDSAVFGSVSATANLDIARYQGTGTSWSDLTNTIVSTTPGMVSSSGQSEFGIFTGTDGNNHPLPIRLSSFTATARGADVLVIWSTASEQNNRGFDIEFSIDGRSFEYVGFVKGAGNSNRILNYNLTDAGAFARTHSRVLYYRLKQLDNNGAFTYSKVVRVENNAGNRNAVSVSPNPFTSEYTINVNVLDEGTSEVEMTDLQGRIVAKQTGTLIRGTNTILVNNISAIQSGVYFVKVTTNNETQVFKLVKE